MQFCILVDAKLTRNNSTSSLHKEDGVGCPDTHRTLMCA